MKLYNLGRIDWLESQLIYHALAATGTEALCLVSPDSPYVCIGFHQDAAREVDLEFCRAGGIPVFRREVGGGAVYLDGDQLFFQLILRRDNPAVPRGISAFYRRFLQPVIEVHRRLGIEAVYKPVNDIVVNHRKISGTGAGEIGECIAFVGNLILDFDYDTMSRVLRIPDEKFRDKLRKTMRENLTTIRRELGEGAARLDEAGLNDMLAAAFEQVLGPLTPAHRDQELMQAMASLAPRMLDEDWLMRKGRRVPGRAVTVRAGLEVVHRLHKAEGGLMRADYTLDDGIVKDLVISGDFFCFPGDAVGRIETLLSGLPRQGIVPVLENFLEEQDMELPGITMSDWHELFRK